MKNRRKHADLIIAWAEGAEIEVCSDKSDIWTLATRPTWNTEFKYRIKPQPEYVPYEVEDYEEASKLVGRTMESKKKDTKVMITVVYKWEDALWINGMLSNVLLKNYILCDGTPIGKLK